MKHLDMDARALATKVSVETDDVLCTIQLVKSNPSLCDRLFDQLVDLLVEGLFLDLRNDLLDGHISADAYANEIAALAVRCRETGLLPLPPADR